MNDRYLELVEDASEREQRPLRVFSEATGAGVWHPWLHALVLRKTREWARAREQEHSLVSSGNGGG
jgi:hypothetical protein